MTGSKYLAETSPKTKRYLEYVPIPKRNTTVKKFSPGKKQVTKYLTDMSKSMTLDTLDAEQMIVTMFQDLQQQAIKANALKLQKALASPEFRLKVSMKKTANKKRKAYATQPAHAKRRSP